MTCSWAASVSPENLHAEHIGITTLVSRVLVPEFSIGDSLLKLCSCFGMLWT